MATKYYEDYQIGARTTVPVNYVVRKEEIFEVAQKWDPQPHHIDEEQARASVFGELTASSVHIFAIYISLAQQERDKGAFQAALGFDELRMHAPILPNDTIRCITECIEKTDSKSKPKSGVIRFMAELHNQRDEVVFTIKSTSLIAKRPL